jgi:hypothetical protein
MPASYLPISAPKVLAMAIIPTIKEESELISDSMLVISDLKALSIKAELASSTLPSLQTYLPR